MFKSIAILVCAASFSLGKVDAQSSGKNEIGINLGGMFYQGDLTPNLFGSFKTVRPAGEIYYQRILTPYWAARLNVAAGGLEGNDSWNAKPEYMRRRNFRFKSPLVEVSALAVFDIFGNNERASVIKFSPYLFAGAGVGFIDVKRDWSRIDSALIHTNSPTLAGLQRDTATAPPAALPVLPFGVGVRYNINQRFSLVAEVKYRLLFTDYLDGFSYAANPERKDGYYSLMLGVSYNFGAGSGSGGRGSIDCPKF